MKSFSLLIATLAIPSSVAFAQTPPPTTNSIPYIPLLGTSGTTGTGGSSSASAWFIDVANNLVVLCSQPATGTGGGGGGTQSFTCTAQPIPTATPGAPAPGAPAPGAPAPGAPAPGAPAPGAPAPGAPGALPS